MHKIVQSGEFLARLLVPLLKTGLALAKNVLKPLAKSVLIQLRTTAAAQQQTQQFKRKFWTRSSFGLRMRGLIVSNEEMNDIMKIVKSREEFGLLIKIVSETIKNEAKEQRGISEHVIRYIRY